MSKILIIPIVCLSFFAPLEILADESANALPDAVAKLETSEKAESKGQTALVESGPGASEKKSDPIAEEIAALKKERDLLAAKNGLRNEKLKSELAELKEEKERLSLQNSLVRERVESELAKSKAELSRIEFETDRMKKELSLEGMRMRSELEKELAGLREEEGRLKAENSLAQTKMEKELSELRLVEAQMKRQRAELDLEVVSLKAQIEIREKNDILKDQVDATQESMHILEPYADGSLKISDRRVALNGVIWSGLADHVIERINFFNNQSSEHPIFVVIDSSPGGSVMAGYQIMKAMQGSSAPVYVVVKSYAASMAAVITTTAERSYAYENAVILHHQLGWYGMTGNLTQQREYADEAQEWWRRLAKPVAEKMGLSLDEFIAMMYEKNSNGDWTEFADNAKQFGWVDEVVDRVWETSVVHNPDRAGVRHIARYGLEEFVDENGSNYVELPRLEPFDFYFLYDRSGYYRIK